MQRHNEFCTYCVDRGEQVRPTPPYTGSQPPLTGDNAAQHEARIQALERRIHQEMLRYGFQQPARFRRFCQRCGLETALEARVLTKRGWLCTKKVGRYREWLCPSCVSQVTMPVKSAVAAKPVTTSPDHPIAPTSTSAVPATSEPAGPVRMVK